MVKRLKDIIKTQLEVSEQTDESAVILTNKAKLSLYKKSVNSGISADILEEVYYRGYTTWNESFDGTPEQFGFDRVNSFISGGFAAEHLDSDLLEGDVIRTKHRFKLETKKGIVPPHPIQGNDVSRGWATQIVPPTDSTVAYHGDKARIFSKPGRHIDVPGGAGELGDAGKPVKSKPKKSSGNVIPMKLNKEEVVNEIVTRKMTAKEKKAFQAYLLRHKEKLKGLSADEQPTKKKFKDYDTSSSLSDPSELGLRRQLGVGYYKNMEEKVKEPTGNLKNACWSGYTAVGMKMKGGRKVPNCVPVKEEEVANAETISKDFTKPSSRFIGSNQLTKVYAEMTPGQLTKAVVKNIVKEQLTVDEGWQDSKYKNPSGGLTKAGVMAYRREHPGSKLKTAVTTPPSKLKKGSKAANRRKSFCARMSGMKKKLTSAKTARDPDSRINKSLRKWNCEETINELNVPLSTTGKRTNTKVDYVDIRRIDGKMVHVPAGKSSSSRGGKEE